MGVCYGDLRSSCQGVCFLYDPRIVNLKRSSFYNKVQNWIHGYTDTRGYINKLERFEWVPAKNGKIADTMLRRYQGSESKTKLTILITRIYYQLLLFFI